MEKEVRKLDFDNNLPDKDAEKIEKELVQFQRTWVIWENYSSDLKPKDGTGQNSTVDADWNERLKEVFSFNDLITFWQFWNKYPGSDPVKFFYDGEKFTYYFISEKRIDGINIFAENIKPKWEDLANSAGLTLILQYDVSDNINEFFSRIKDFWLKLTLLVIGETIPCGKYVSFIY